MDIRRYRLEKDWSQEELAFESGIHQTYLSGVENGNRNPTVAVLKKLADALGVRSLRRSNRAAVGLVTNFARCGKF